ncbi:hypothetical protein F4861DRAFT_537882 [Xylaria intraflava]|nr:hypothetical protein F4861DRAFT_537882 [Xylaria intraflava]
MEKYSQFRDKGSGVAPFLPTLIPISTTTKLIGICLFVLRLPLFATYCALYFIILDHLPLPQFMRKILLWTMLGIPNIWWVDLQLDGVRRGALSRQPESRFPRRRAVVAAQFTSPVDAVYLAAIFDPIFVVSYPGTRKVRRVSLFRAVAQALAIPPLSAPPPPTALTTLRALVEQNPHRVIAAFPEMTTTNGKGILPLSPSLLSCPADVSIFPVSIRYTMPDITTPIPGAWRSFLWNLLCRPKHYIRVRVAEGVSVAPGRSAPAETETETAGSDGDDLTADEVRVLDQISDALARLSMSKRVGLTVRDKVAYVAQAAPKGSSWLRWPA